MVKVVGVRFRNAGKIYFFAPGEFNVKRGTNVIVETVRGIEYGTCVNDPKDITDDELVSPLKPILRIATERDDEQAKTNRAKEREAFDLCKQKIIERELEMKLIDAEYTFDNSKILFYFTADGRVDFRELVKDLAGVFRTRIELRQVGVRDETKIIGGIGICGRPLCCHSYLSDFVPVSIKMAKEQNLSLNPTKISGVCGRLMCCLNNEEEVYEEQNRKLPSAGDYVTTSAGERGVVTNVNIFRETIKVLVQNGDEKELKEYRADEIKFKKHRKRGKFELSPEEMEQLKALEPDGIVEEDEELFESKLDVEKTSSNRASNAEEPKKEREENKNDKNDRDNRKKPDNKNHSAEHKNGGNRNNKNNKSHGNQQNRNREQTPANEQTKVNGENTNTIVETSPETANHEKNDGNGKPHYNKNRHYYKNKKHKNSNGMNKGTNNGQSAD